MLKEILRESVNFIPYNLRRHITYLPGIAALQRLLVERSLSGDPFVHTLNGGPAAGLRFEITLPRDKSIWAGTYEHDFAWSLADSVRPGGVCYDIGGYRGYMSGVMALSGASKVLAFEPLPVNQHAFRRLCELNPELPIAVMPLAAGNLDARSGLRGRDELARLGHAFDAMADEIARTQTRLHRDIAERIKGVLGDSSSHVIDVYRIANPGATPSDLYFLIVSDNRYGAPVMKIAERRAALHTQSWLPWHFGRPLRRISWPWMLTDSQCCFPKRISVMGAFPPLM